MVAQKTTFSLRAQCGGCGGKARLPQGQLGQFVQLESAEVAELCATFDCVIS